MVHQNWFMSLKNTKLSLKLTAKLTAKEIAALLGLMAKKQDNKLEALLISEYIKSRNEETLGA